MYIYMEKLNRYLLILFYRKNYILFSNIENSLETNEYLFNFALFHIYKSLLILQIKGLCHVKIQTSISIKLKQIFSILSKRYYCFQQFFFSCKSVFIRMHLSLYFFIVLKLFTNLYKHPFNLLIKKLN